MVLVADLCTVDGHGLRDHQTNAAATSGDEGNAALQIEQAVSVQLAMAGSCDALGCHSGCLCREYQENGAMQTEVAAA